MDRGGQEGWSEERQKEQGKWGRQNGPRKTEGRKNGGDYRRDRVRPRMIEKAGGHEV